MIDMTENIKMIEDIEKTKQGMKASLTLAAQTAHAFNRKTGLETPENYSRVIRMYNLQSRIFQKIAADCTTIGEVQKKLLTRYTAFMDAIRELSREKPSIARFEKLCQNCTWGVQKSLQNQDYSIFALPAFHDALQLLSDRPLTPEDEELAACDFLFSQAETDRIEASVRPLFTALDRLCTYDLQKVMDCLSPTQIALYKMLDEKDIRSLFFEKLPNARYRYLPDMWNTLLVMTSCLSQNFFHNSPDFDYSALPVASLLPRKEEVLPILLSLDHIADQNILAGTPELTEMQILKTFNQFKDAGALSAIQTQQETAHENGQEYTQTMKEATQRQQAHPATKEPAAALLQGVGKGLACLANHYGTSSEPAGKSNETKPLNLPFFPVMPGSAPAIAAEPPRQTFEPGPWAKRFVTSVSVEKREIRVKGRKTPLICPPKAGTPWNLLVRLLTSTDPDGWIELTDDYEADAWRNSFCRSGKNRKTKSAKRLAELLSFIESKNKRGVRGAVCIRLRPKS